MVDNLKNFIIHHKILAFFGLPYQTYLCGRCKDENEIKND